MKCTHCEHGIPADDHGIHRCLGWEIPCRRDMTEEEAALMWKALLDSSELLYEIEPQSLTAGQ